MASLRKAKAKEKADHKSKHHPSPYSLPHVRRSLSKVKTLTKQFTIENNEIKKANKDINLDASYLVEDNKIDKLVVPRRKDTSSRSLVSKIKSSDSDGLESPHHSKYNPKMKT